MEEQIKTKWKIQYPENKNQQCFDCSSTENVYYYNEENGQYYCYECGLEQIKLLLTTPH